MDPFQRYYVSAINFLKYRPRSEKEVRDRLIYPKNKRKAGRASDIDKEVVEQVIAKLKEQKFINDAEFIRWWIDQRTRFKPRSMRLIKQELHMKGISSEDIDEAMGSNITNYDPPAGGTITHDLAQAKALVAKKIPRYSKLPEDKKKEKLMRLLASRGFSYDTIKDVLKYLA